MALLVLKPGIYVTFKTTHSRNPLCFQFKANVDEIEAVEMTLADAKNNPLLHDLVRAGYELSFSSKA